MTMTSTIATWAEPIKNALYNAYTGIIDFVSDPFAKLSGFFKGNVNPDRQNLDALRNKHFSLIDTESAKATPDFVELSKGITADTKQYITNMIDEEVKKLGNAPCDFSIVTLGSMARQESGPVTDLEIGFLIKEKTIENYQYFYQLSQNISDRLFLLGEHPDIGGKGLRMDEADNAPPHLRFFARNTSPEKAKALVKDAVMNREWDKIPFEGSRPFLATAEEFANYSREKFTQNKKQLENIRRKQYDIELQKALKHPKNAKLAKTEQGRKEIEKEVRYWLDLMYRPYSPRELRTANDAGKTLGRNMALLHGNQALYNKFSSLREGHFNQKDKNGISLRQNLAKNIMAGDIRDLFQKGKSVYVTGKLGKTMDIKREFYRFTEQFVTNLGFYHQCKSQNSLEIVKELTEKGILSNALSAKMTDFIQFATALRLKEQAVIKRQGKAAYFNQEQFDEDKEDLEKAMNQIKQSIDYLEKAKQAPELIAAKKRELVKLESDYHHLLDMAPGKILSAKDVEVMKQKYIPIAHEIFQVAQEWTKGSEKLDLPLLPGFTPKMQEALDLLHKQPNGFFPALRFLKQQQSDLNKNQLQAFVGQCQKEKLITPADVKVIKEYKERRAAKAA